MRFAKLSKPPSLLSPLPPPSKVLEKNKLPGGLNRGFTVLELAKGSCHTVSYFDWANISSKGRAGDSWDHHCRSFSKITRPIKGIMHCVLCTFISQSQGVQKFSWQNQYCGEVNSFRSFPNMQTEETYDLREWGGGGGGNIILGFLFPFEPL